MRDRDATPAYGAALALSVNPGLASRLRRRPLPDGVRDILRILAERGSSDVDAENRLKLEYYVQNVLLYPGASPHRILGVNVDASREDMRSNMRMLMLWLHPDAVGCDVWRTAFAPRVLAAWREVSTGRSEERISVEKLNRSDREISSRTKRRTDSGRPAKYSIRPRPPLARLRGSSETRKETRHRRRVRKLAILSLVAAALFGAYLFMPPSKYMYVPGVQVISDVARW